MTPIGPICGVSAGVDPSETKLIARWTGGPSET